MNMQQLVQAMQKTQREFNKEYAVLEAKEFIGKANGVVEVKVKGDLSLLEVKILDDDLLKEKDELCEMIVLAFNKAKEEITKESDAISAKYQKTGGMPF